MSLKLLNVGLISDYQAAVFVVKCVNGLTPDIFKSFYQISSDLHNHGTWQSNNIVVDPGSFWVPGLHFNEITGSTCTE